MQLNYISNSPVCIVPVHGFIVTVVLLKKASHVADNEVRVVDKQQILDVVWIVLVELKLDSATTVIGIDVVPAAQGKTIVSANVQS